MRFGYGSITFILASMLLLGCSKQYFAIIPEQDIYVQSVAYNADVDMLWVVDDSDSMLKRQQTIAAQIEPFISALQATKMNFNMAVTTTDMRERSETAHGRFLPLDSSSPRVLTSAIPDLVHAFGSRLIAGDQGSTIEQGLGAMKRALSPDYLNYENKGFLRDGSFLVVMFLSDEDDHSSTSDDYQSFLDQLRPVRRSGERGWMAHYIGVVQNDSDCTTEGRGFTDPGTRYIALAQASGGITQTICTADFARTLQNVKARIIERISQFNLSREPNVETIKVRVNGTLIAKDVVNGWTYSAEGFTITFHGASVPPADAVIKIDYDPAGPKS